eukprot:5153373-Alexandrium_andersonii.AAC.1
MAITPPPPPPRRPRVVPPPQRDFPAGAKPNLFALPAPGDPPALCGRPQETPREHPRGLAWK